MGSKLAWPSSRPCRMRSRNSSKSALREDITKCLHARLSPTDSNQAARGLDDEMSLEREFLKLLQHILSGQPEELPIRMCWQRIISNPREMEIVSEISRGGVRYPERQYTTA